MARGDPTVLGREELRVSCPACGAALTLGRLVFAGMPIFVDARCASCGRAFVLDWPAGHALLHPTLVDERTGDVYFDGLEWYPRRIARCLASRTRPVDAAISVRSHGAGAPRAVVVNCVDFLYGHCLLKLLSGLSFRRSDPDADTVVIVPRLLRWLVPPSVAAVVELDLPLSRMESWIDGLDDAVRGVVSAYETIVIAPGISQPPVTAVDLAEAVGGDPTRHPFWNAPPATPALVSFILREDRLWLGKRPPLLVRALGLVSPRLRDRALVRRQNGRIASVARRVRRALPDVEFAAVGIGRSGAVPAEIEDLRQTAMTTDSERRWLATYARSRVVVGVHGSHMLLPSAFAGAVVELVPAEKLPNVTQDLIVAGETEREPKLTLFRYRLLPASTTPEAVADVVVSILTSAGRHHRNVIENRAAYDRVGWPRPPEWRLLPP